MRMIKAICIAVSTQLVSPNSKETQDKAFLKIEGVGNVAEIDLEKGQPHNFEVGKSYEVSFNRIAEDAAEAPANQDAVQSDASDTAEELTKEAA